MEKLIPSKNQLVSKTVNNIWKSFNRLTNYSLSTDDSSVILLLISLFKYDFLKNLPINPSESALQIIEETIINSKSPLKEFFEEQYLLFSSPLIKINGSNLNAINSLFSSSQIEMNEYFSDVFDQLLFIITEVESRGISQTIIPLAISSLIVKLGNVEANGRVLNPFAGYASLGVVLGPKVNYFGQDSNRKSWSLGLLRLLAYGKTKNNRYKCSSSTSEWPADEKFDLIASTPLFREKLNQNAFIDHPKVETTEQLCIEKGLLSISEKGRIVLLVTTGFLYRGRHDFNLRKYLVEADLLDTLILLPAGITGLRGTPSILIIISKVKDHPGKVKLLNAKDFITKQGPRTILLNEEEILSNLKIRTNTDRQRIVNNKEIETEGFDLSIDRYFKKEYDGIAINEFLTPLSSKACYADENDKVIRARDLKDDEFGFFLTESKIDYEGQATNSQNTREIKESCLLVTTRYDALKPTIFIYKGAPIYITAGIHAFRIDESRVNIAFLVNELRSKYVEEQLQHIRYGDTVPDIRLKDLLEVKIKVLTLSEQLAKVEGLNELASRIKNLQAERNCLAHGFSRREFNEFASLKHTLGRPMQNILSWSENLKSFFNKNHEEIRLLDENFSKFYEVTIIETLNEIKRDISFINNILEKGENGLVLKRYKLDLIPLTKINEIASEISTNGFKFELRRNLLEGEGLTERGINSNAVLFKTLIDNILTNSNKHGFIEESNSNKVSIEFSEQEGNLLMVIKNNGLPFPSNFDRDKFIQKFSTANKDIGSGIGGYDINRIAGYLGDPEWKLLLDESLLSPVEFNFCFPIKSLN